MAVRTPADFIYYLIGRLPLLLIAAGVLWVVMQGLLHLEMYSFGTEFFVGNHETTNVMPIPRGDADVLADALATGDVEQMELALAQVEARHGAGSAPVVAG